MAIITITIDNDDLSDVIDALAEVHSYDPESGLTKTQFVKDWFKGYIISTVKEWRKENYLEANPPIISNPTITVTGIIFALIFSAAALYFSLTSSTTHITVIPETIQE